MQQKRTIPEGKKIKPLTSFIIIIHPSLAANTKIDYNRNIERMNN